MAEPLHTLTAKIRGYTGAVDWSVCCPHDGRGDNRDCQLYWEVFNCPWVAFDDSDHHPDCPSWNERQCEDFTALTGTNYFRCWEGRVPEPCDGGPFEYRHGHPIEGCAVKEAVYEGLGQGVEWDESAYDLPVVSPIRVNIKREDSVLLLVPVLEEVRCDR